MAIVLTPAIVVHETFVEAGAENSSGQWLSTSRKHQKTSGDTTEVQIESGFTYLSFEGHDSP